jgi:hypothetical protein
VFLTWEIERFGIGILEMYNLIKERGLKPPLISLDEGFKLTIWRHSAYTVHNAIHDTIYDTVHDASSTFTEIAELTHRLVLVIQGEMSIPLKKMQFNVAIPPAPSFRSFVPHSLHSGAYGTPRKSNSSISLYHPKPG